ncbi:hypothetical protein EG329_010460 [Mollisiaceae sp. DMI_Dod_QoI]|nr:hypothetical protein EG329_010460 [Helotiales sp. DMI_Dod_QoI]
MRLRNRMITGNPTIEEPVADDTQEDTSSTSTRAQVGSPLSTRTRSFSTSDRQQTPLTPIPEDGPARTLGQHAHYYRSEFHEDFILYSQSDTDDGIGEEQGANAYLSPQTRPYRPLAPRSEMSQTQQTQASISSSVAQAFSTQQDMTPQREHSTRPTQLPTPSQTNMMPHFEREPGPWSPTSPTDAESRKRKLSVGIPDLNDFPKDRHWDDKMQTDLKKIEQGQEDSDEERKRLRKRRRGKKAVPMPLKPGRKDDKHGPGGDGRGGSQGGGQAVIAS